MADVFIVELGKLFSKHLQNFPEQDRKAIYLFSEHIKQRGFGGLEGKNKSSDDVPFSDPDFVAKVEYAVKNHLWHYHIGIVRYDLTKPYGQRTSEYVLHYQLLGDVVKLVDYSPHPPFELPKKAYLD